MLDCLERMIELKNICVKVIYFLQFYFYMLNAMNCLYYEIKNFLFHTLNLKQAEVDEIILKTD